ncbi:hypothetical protein PNK_1169 [Candidatus Protochlamydia naegleriophila]|uniref:Uncharacterized protein n=1 Tax=Candidatus Protochlamydia naegleriophila TaxID=389348 RepID=A0A0U5JDV6_9BACT|nr:hypothetical protein [Candidatus Protochlamydia naegleriophila]CUI16786.1 hypothetical protein PNK_1169 [Candidatus Protochlamydia naegleriophila]
MQSNSSDARKIDDIVSIVSNILGQSYVTELNSLDQMDILYKQVKNSEKKVVDLTAINTNLLLKAKRCF